MKKNGGGASGVGSHGNQPQEVSARAPGAEHCRDAVPQSRRRWSKGAAGQRMFFALTWLAVCGLAHANVGRTPGTFYVDQDGAATYTIPIFAPRGPNGLEPHISLVNVSQDTDYTKRNAAGLNTARGYTTVANASIGSANGVDVSLGVGWHIAGLSEIYRCNKTVAQDGTAVGVALATSDGYCLDGQRLRLTSGTYGTAGSVYQTEIADFAQVTAEGTSGNENGPDHFEVQGKDGLTYEYGNGGNSQVLVTGGSAAWQWWLDKVTDRAGNTMTISYSTDNADAEVVPDTISWTPSGYGSTQYNYTMKFTYTADSQYNFTTGYAGGLAYDNYNLLQSIAINYGGSTIKEYFLNYQVSPTTSRELLDHLQECADSAKSNCLPPTQFTYQPGQTGLSNPVTAISTTAVELKTHNDFTGIGYNDLAYCNGGSPSIIYVAFASQSGYGTPVNTGIHCETPLYGDLTGSGKDGILAPNGADWWYYTWNGSAFAGQDTGLAYDSAASQYALADVNGDGLPDLISAYQTSQTSYGVTTYYFTIDVRTNTTTGGSISLSSSQSQWYSTSVALPMSGTIMSDTDYGYGVQQSGTLKSLDFDGDGRKDLGLEEAVRTCTVCTTYNVYYYELLSRNSSFSATQILANTGVGYGSVAFLDFNSDTCTDYLTNSKIYVSGCNGFRAARR